MAFHSVLVAPGALLPMLSYPICTHYLLLLVPQHVLFRCVGYNIRQQRGTVVQVLQPIDGGFFYDQCRETGCFELAEKHNHRRRFPRHAKTDVRTHVNTRHWKLSDDTRPTIPNREASPSHPYKHAVLHDRLRTVLHTIGVDRSRQREILRGCLNTILA